MDGARATRNAASSVAQTVLSAVLLFGLYRYLLGAVGADGIGIWSVVLASTGAARIADLGLTGSAVKYVASYLAKDEPDTAGAVAETTIVTVGVVIGAMAIAAYFVVGALLHLFIEPAGLEAAQELLPWACVSFWLVSVAGAAQSALDGCARYDLRNAILLGAQVVYVGLAVVLVGPYGLVGLALAQIAQGVLWFGGLWIALRQRLPGLGMVPRRWRGALVREMLSYGVNFQILGVLRMLFEPTTKALMSRYGGLDLAGYYEMAAMAVFKFRSLLVAAVQVITPEITTLDEREPGRVNEAYQRVDRLNWALSVPLFAAVAAGAPLISHVWIGAYEPEFILFMVILAVGWLASTLSVPAFFLLLGTGQMRHVVLSHVTIAVVNAAVAVVLGRLFGGSGVAWAWALALALGTVHLLVGLWRQRRAVSVPPARLLAMGLGVSLAAGGALALALTSPESLGLAAAAAVGFGAVALLVFWPQPERARITAALGGLIGR